MAEFLPTFGVISGSGNSLSTDDFGNVVVNYGGEQTYTIPNSYMFGIDPNNTNFHYYSTQSSAGVTPDSTVGLPFIDATTTVDSAFYATRLFPAPVAGSVQTDAPVQTGTFTNVLAMDADFALFLNGGLEVPTSGPVTHIVDENSRIVVNITLEGHQLHPGLIVRHVYEDDDGRVWIETLGAGVGPLAIVNSLGAPFMWPNLPDQNIRDFLKANDVGFVGSVGDSSVDPNGVFPLIVQLHVATQEERVEILKEFFEENPEVFHDNNTIQVIEELVGPAGTVEVVKSVVDNGCFASGTTISMSDGSTKCIEDVLVGDRVVSYNQSGALVSQFVSDTFQHNVSHLISVHGLKVTPGHMTLCGDGQFEGRHVPIIDILLSDGALVKEDDSLVRIAINKPVGSLEDHFVKVSYALNSDDAKCGNLQSGEIRVGTLLFDKDGEPVSILDCIKAEGMAFDPETGLVAREGEEPEPLYFFGSLPRPEDYILRRSEETLEGILTDGEWEGSPSELIADRLRRTSSVRVN